jgi:hypothetical protein
MSDAEREAWRRERRELLKRMQATCPVAVIPPRFVTAYLVGDMVWEDWRVAGETVTLTREAVGAA